MEVRVKRFAASFLVSVLGAITLIGVAPVVAGAASSPVIGSFASNSRSVPGVGGFVVLTAKVRHSSLCVFSSSPAARGLPVTLPCRSGVASRRVQLPGNPGPSRVFTLRVIAQSGANRSSRAVRVTQAARSRAFAWSAPVNVDPNLGVQNMSFSSVSCPVTNYCVAVDVLGSAFVYNGKGWSSPKDVDPGNQLRSVSCASKTFCVAIDNVGNVLTFDGSGWSSPTNLERVYLPNYVSFAISCPTTTFCAVVDGNGYAATLNGSTWSKLTLVDPGNQLNAVSCANATHCVALDYMAGDAVIFDNSSWSAPVAISKLDLGDSLSCPSTIFCTIVDDVGPTLNSSQVLTLNGTAATDPTAIDPSAWITSVSCSSAVFCVAVDSAGRVLSFNGMTWTAPKLIDENNTFTSVSCASTNFCVAVDEAGNVLVAR